MFSVMVTRILYAVVAATLMSASGCSHAVESPEWWRSNRAIYASFALSGAGGPLMKFPSEGITKKLKSFDDLPILLDDARKLGCNCIYLIDYWEGGYENKGDYVPRADLGGPEAFKRGVAGIHEKGGKIILYLEAFIVHRKSKVGELHPDWAMIDERGDYYTYYGRDRFYLMYPGEGSGWTSYICGVAEYMTRRYGVDGFHLDSYGLQWDWKDYHPKHPGATNPSAAGGFNQGAIRLVRTMRERIRKINPDAVVILEGCERTELLDVCDGGQLDSAAWQYSPMKVLLDKPWVNERKYKAFTSHFSIIEMEKILDMGYNLSLAPWWFQDLPDEDDFLKMRKPMDDRDDWKKRITTLWHWDNLLYANGATRPSEVDLFQLRRDLEMQQWNKELKTFDTPEYWKAVDAYEPLLRRLMSSGKPVKTQAEHLRALLTKAQG